MRSSRRQRRNRTREPEELNITTFMNLMVILVPFLLITAVFSRMAIIELNLPTGDAAQIQNETPQFALEVIVREEAIHVGERTEGVANIIPMIDGRHNLKSLTDYLKRVKAIYPEELAVTLLLEQDTDYEILVQVMDAVRSYRIDNPDEIGRAELFPEISIGDAPVMAAR
jgi:biopolymer transport protein ExbD